MTDRARTLQRQRFSDSKESDSRSSDRRRAKIDSIGVVCNADIQVRESPVRAAVGQMSRKTGALPASCFKATKTTREGVFTVERAGTGAVLILN